MTDLIEAANELRKKHGDLPTSRSCPVVTFQDGTFIAQGVRRCSGGAVYAKGEGETRDAAYRAWRDQAGSRALALQQEEATQRWAAKTGTAG